MRKVSGILVAALGAALPAALGAQTPAAAPVSLSLSQAVAIARDTTPAVQLAQLRIEESRARVGEVRSELLPNISGQVGELNRTFNLRAMGLEFPSAPGQPSLPDLVGPFSVFDARFRLSQTLFDPAGWVRTQAARQAVDVSTAERVTAAESSSQRAAAAYLRAERAQATVAARREDVRLAEELVSVAKTQSQAGVGTVIDVTRAESQRVTAVGLLRVAENQAQQAQIELARAMGVDPGTRFVIADSLFAGTAGSDAPLSVEEATQRALAARPELRSAAAMETAARTTRRSIQAERLPRLDLVANWGVNGLNVGDAFPTREIGVQVSVPILDGLRRESRLQEQEAVLRETQVRSGDLREQVAAEVRAAILDEQSGREQQEVAAERLRLAEEELRQSRERFENGVAGNIEVINAQSNLVRARDAVIDARFATAQARVALARAVGVTGSLR